MNLCVKKRVGQNRLPVLSHHHGEDDGGGGDLDDPEDDEAGQLDHGEDVDLPERHVAQVDEVRLVLVGHAEQLDAVEELQSRGDVSTASSTKQRSTVGADRPGCL